MLYIAYGSNLHVGQMKGRCPAAIKVGKTILPDCRLVFRRHADVEERRGAKCHVGIWHITAKCERELDRYEGVRGGYYRKEYLPLRITRKGIETTEDGLIYIMNRGGYEAPDQFYFDTIRIGYDNFGLPQAALKAADRLTTELAKAERDERKAVIAGEWGIVE
jgi:hypothetical protein